MLTKKASSLNRGWLGFVKIKNDMNLKTEPFVSQSVDE